LKFSEAFTLHRHLGAETVLNEFTASFDRPFAINFNTADKNLLIISSVIYMVGITWYFTEQKNYMTGKEHGSAKWGTKDEFRKLYDKHLENNILFTKDAKLSLNDRKTRKNNNVLIIGGTGAGKTRFYVKPNLMQMHSSYVITDPKGELYRSTAKMLRDNNYKIKVLNLIDMKQSNKYNPFNYIRKDEDILKLVNVLMKNLKDKEARTGENFWEDSTRALLHAVIAYIYYEQIKIEQNMQSVMDMLLVGQAKEADEDFESPLDIIFKNLEVEKPNHIAVKQYKIFKQGTGKTAKSILTSTSSRLTPFNIQALADLTSIDNMELDTIGDEKTAVFVIIPDSDDTYNFIASIMYTQMFDTLYDKSDNHYNAPLPIPVRCMLDEFANIGQIPLFHNLITTMRSRNISANVIIQNLGQIKSLYKDTWENIIDNCDSLLFLGGQGQNTLEYISKRLGKQTIDTRTTSRSRGRMEGANINFGILGRDLMTADEIARMRDEECILLIKGLNPLKDKKYKIETHKRYKELIGG
jgi:type IV secretion system protein VirD4